MRGIGPIHAGDDLAAKLLGALRAAKSPLLDGDVLAVSSKIVAKALDLWRDDRDVAVQEESVAVVAERATAAGTARIVRAAAGPVMAAAGVDASNLGPEPGGAALVLPRDPDAEAVRLRARLLGAAGLSRLGVVLTDTAGRPWRHGQSDFALGAAGVTVVEDLRGATDADGGPLQVTVRALADELAAAAELLKGKAHGVPAVVVRGLGELCTSGEGPGAADLVRAGAGDWFRFGAVDAVRAALGTPPGTPGVPAAPAVLDGDPKGVLARAVAVTEAGRGGDASLGRAQVRLRHDDPDRAPVVEALPLDRSPEALVAAARLAERVRTAAAAEDLLCRVVLAADHIDVHPPAPPSSA